MITPDGSTTGDGTIVAPSGRKTDMMEFRDSCVDELEKRSPVQTKNWTKNQSRQVKRNHGEGVRLTKQPSENNCTDVR